MSKKMLIDATHPEETRVVVVDGTKVTEFDFESLTKRQLAGNIYLAKVTRVEPSLQAAFVDYGGNRHGFLAFSEIHSDYYQIPAEDRAALQAEEESYAKAMADIEKRNEDASTKRRTKAANADEVAIRSDVIIDLDVDDTGLVDVPETTVDGNDLLAHDAPQPVDASEEPATDDDTLVDPATPTADPDTDTDGIDQAPAPAADMSEQENPDTDPYDNITDHINDISDEDTDHLIRPRKPRQRRYKIQEVIKVRQILLVQVVKEERGNKGAALTTYLSLAGRYCVLMPNTARGGGISRKITNVDDRKKIKKITADFAVPDGAGLIVRTAGAKRTKSELKRDYEYLMRQWQMIRDTTLNSIAPCQIHAEGDLIKRSMRDLYNSDIEEVLVEGERAYEAARAYMKLLTPSHVRRVKQYTDRLALFSRYQVENYLDSMFNPTVTLKSGGYIVIGVTEALVAIDVNSGKATKESSIEKTALKTNLEAAEEVAHQMRLRDLAGLIVIDFIDMEERRNNQAVERRLKESIKSDRARIQLGGISGFGLLEMSRQRLRPGMIEATTAPCPHCHGTGVIRSANSLALSILREVEEEATRKNTREIAIRAPIDVANYLINYKREHIAQIEAQFGLSVLISADSSLLGSDYTLEKHKTSSRILPDPIDIPDVSNLDFQTDDADDTADSDESQNTSEDDADKPKRKRRRRRGGRGRNKSAKPDEAQSTTDEDPAQPATEVAAQAAQTDSDNTQDVAPTEPEAEAEVKPKRRRRSKKAEAEKETEQAQASSPPETMQPAAEPEKAVVEKPKRGRPRKTKKQDDSTTPSEQPLDDAKPKPKRTRKTAAKKPDQADHPQDETVNAPTGDAPTAPTSASDAATTTEMAAKPKRNGWWSRASKE